MQCLRKPAKEELRLFVSVSSSFTFDKRHRFRAGPWIRTESAKHCRGNGLRISLSHATKCHARVFSFDDDHDTERFQSFEQGVRDIRSQAFLQLKSARERLCQASKF